MFEDGYITFNATSSVVHRLTISSEPIRAVLIAVFSTIVSYQLAGALTDLYFGFKPPFISTAQNIQIFIQTRRSSIQPLYNALFRGRADDSKNKLKPTVVFTLFLLILLAPLVNIGAIFLTTEYDSFHTFDDVKFGGLALGINNSAQPTPQTSLMSVAQCRMIPVKLSEFEYSLVDFFLCLADPDTVHELKDGEASVAVYAQTRGISVRFHNSHEQRILIFEAFFYVNDLNEQGKITNGYALSHRVEESEIEELAEYIMTMIESSCETDSRTRKATKRKEDLGMENVTSDFFHGLVNECHQNGFNDTFLSELEANITSRITMKSTDTMEAYRRINGKRDPDPDENVGSEVFLRRRYIHANVTVFAIVAVATVLFRFFVNLVTRNDVSKGMGLLVRDALSLPCIDSMLQRREIFTW